MLSLFQLDSFPNEEMAFIFNVLFVIVLIFELKVLLRQRKSSSDKGSLIFIIISVFVPLLITLLANYLSIGKINTNVSYFGIFILLFGFILRQYSVYVLGKFFVPVVKLQKGQKLIREGPYRLIRHPSYTGLLLEIAGFGLALSNIIGFFAALLFFIPAVLYRIKIEERFLVQNLKGYKEYVKESWKLVPFVY